MIHDFKMTTDKNDKIPNSVLRRQIQTLWHNRTCARKMTGFSLVYQMWPKKTIKNKKPSCR